MAQQNSGIGLGGFLFLLFTTLKLTGHIDWSWWWVTAPLWIPVGVVLAVAIAVGIIAAAKN